VQKKKPPKIWVQYQFYKMQQQRHFAGFIPFFCREDSHRTAVLQIIMPRSCTGSGFQHMVALKCPLILVKTLISVKKTVKIGYCPLKK